MKFKITKGILTVKSESGKTYTIDRNGCSCIGFGWKRKCRHFSEAKAKGWTEKLPVVKKEFGSFTKTPFIIKSRKDAIRKWMEKNEYKIIEKVVDKIESFMTYKTSMEEILACVKK